MLGQFHIKKCVNFIDFSYVLNNKVRMRGNICATKVKLEIRFSLSNIYTLKFSKRKSPFRGWGKSHSIFKHI